ncbi:MAG: AAA family ATPase [Chloroflexi bacterium]|nr:AAA family ATPase [Chloroflexota bacterium]
MSDVFISYVEEDADVVEPLAQALTESGYSCWHYRRDSTPGTSYLTQITDAISGAKVVLLVLSPQTLDSFQVDKEINYAHECNKPFLPVVRDLAWGEFQRRRPTWHMAIGTTVAIPLPTEGITALLPRLIAGLRSIGLGVSNAPVPAPVVAMPVVGPMESAPVTRPIPARLPLTAPVAAPGALPSRAALVGRAEELRFLQEQYNAVAAGLGGRLIFICGEPGVGKTRLAQELGLYAWGQGGLFLEGTYLRDGTAPYGPWIDVLRPSVRGLARQVRERLANLYGAELSVLFPELDLEYGPFATAARSPEEQRRRLFDGLAELVGALASQQPLVLLLNDLQWSPGLAELIHLSRHWSGVRALVIGTFREQELKAQPALMRDWAELNRSRLAIQVSLQPLAEAESTQLIAGYFGAEPAAQLREIVHRRTRGNVFFIEEVLRSLVETGAVQASTTGWKVVNLGSITIPESIKVVVEERVAGLGGAGREILAQAAVLGQEFSFPALQRLTGRSEEELLDVVERAVTARLLVDRSLAGEERFAFADDQVQEVLHGALSPLRRRRLHLRAGQTLEAWYAGQLDAHVEELAYHFREANDAEKALEYTLQAAEQAYDRAIWERASQQFEAALALLDAWAQEQSKQAHVLERLSYLDAMLARPGLHHAERALALHVELGDLQKSARFHRLVAASWYSGMAGEANFDKAFPHLEAAVELLADAPDCAEKSYAYSWLTFGLTWGKLELERAHSCGVKALDLARRVGDLEAAAHAETYLALTLAYRGDLKAAEEQAEQSWTTALRGNDPWIGVLAAFFPLVFWPWRNDRAWIEQWQERYRGHRERTHVGRFDRPAHGLWALAAALTGTAPLARRALTQSQEASARDPDHWPYFEYLAGSAHAILGDLDPADRRFSQAQFASETGGYQAFIVESAAHRARFLLARSAVAEAEVVLNRGYTLARARKSVVQELNLAPLLCELHVMAKCPSTAEPYLERAREILAQPQRWSGLAAAVQRAEGVLATAKQDWVEAEHAFAQALETERAHGFRYNVAHILGPWAELYLQRDEPGDRERGLEKLDQALAIFEQCAAMKDIEKVLARRTEVAV